MRRGGGISQAGRSCALSGANVSKIPLEKPLRGEGEVMVLGVTRPQTPGAAGILFPQQNIARLIELLSEAVGSPHIWMNKLY